MQSYDRPAFPRPASIDTRHGTLPDGDTVVPEQEGLTLREYAAVHALAGYLAWSPEGSNLQASPDVAAAHVVRFADALLAELAKPKVPRLLCEVCGEPGFPDNGLLPISADAADQRRTDIPHAHADGCLAKARTPKAE